MLSIESTGAQSILDFLKHPDKPGSGSDVRQILEVNQFFVDYYCQWSGINFENLVELLTCFNQPGWQATSPVLEALSQGFHHAATEIDVLQRKLNFLKGVDPSGLMYRALAHLPAGTPVNSVIHLTIDRFNGGFQFRGEIGLSLLQDITNPDSFSAIVSHELHHAGFRYWAEKDLVRQELAREESCRSVAVQHVENLLSEGLANFYCSPMKIDPEKMSPALVARLEQLQRDEHDLLTQAVHLLTASLAPDADRTECQQAYNELAIDLNGIQPAGHYLGARMVEIMSQVHPHERIIECVRSLPDFPALYNLAAEKIGMPVFDPVAVNQFRKLW